MSYDYDTFTRQDWAQAFVEGWEIEPVEVWAFCHWKRREPPSNFFLRCEYCNEQPGTQKFRWRWGLRCCYSCIRKYAMIDWIEIHRKFHAERNRLIRHYRDADEEAWLTRVS